MIRPVTPLDRAALVGNNEHAIATLHYVQARDVNLDKVGKSLTLEQLPYEASRQLRTRHRAGSNVG